MTYRSPGVYVEEISLFPPSVAEVETAIPAFVGYTEKAEFKGKELGNTAVEVASLVDFRERFGGGPPLVVDEVVLDENNNVSNVTTSNAYYMFDAIQLYFLNGGGRCYVVSVGTYKDASKSDTAIQNGLDVIAKEDEPTMLLFPDAPLLGASKLYGLQKYALTQAADLMDRFVVMDLIEDPGKSFKENYIDFRNNIGINNLDYGAAYTPYLKARLPKNVTFRQLKNSLKKYSSAVELQALTEEPGVKETITRLNNLLDDDKTLNVAITGLKDDDKKSLEENYLTRVNDFKKEANAAVPTETTVRSKFKDLCTFCYDALDEVYDELAKSGSALKGSGDDSLAGYIKKQITDQLVPVAVKLNSYVHNAQAKIGGTTINKMYNTYTWDAAQWGADTFDDTKVTENNDIYPEDAGEKVANMLAGEKAISGVFKGINGALGDLLKSVASLEKNLERTLAQQLPVYKNIVTAVNDSLTAIPPSGAMAGVYCMVDRSRGVWKAPANVSLAGVDGLSVRIDNTIQDDLNIDVNAGKSINAIRAFAGKGLIVWGARTLAGNDNEWRYISVRRFFNMVEESVKKSTYWAVFEPNDANLWIKVKAMIDNYLVLKWRQGALAGATPDDAFFVKVGLGQTMSSQDILEGRLIIDIGMAVVRPAEFIILRFMHKMQES